LSWFCVYFQGYETNFILKPIFFILKDTNFFDDKVASGKEYEYRVIAVNEGGESPPSSEFVTVAKPEKGKLLMEASQYVENLY